MLTLTENATDFVKTLVDQVPDAQAGLRISASETEAATFDLAVATEPAPSDSVVEARGARVFLEERAASILDDKQLDARVDDAGAFSFSVANQ
jgi:Fe-S cluster assembly iron-binding protein IscA